RLTSRYLGVIKHINFLCLAAFRVAGGCYGRVHGQLLARLGGGGAGRERDPHASHLSGRASQSCPSKTGYDLPTRRGEQEWHLRGVNREVRRSRNAGAARSVQPGFIGPGAPSGLEKAIW